MTNALRPGELFALRWKSFNHAECTMQLIETVYKGKIRPWGKTRKSLGVVHIPKELADDLRLWKRAMSRLVSGGRSFSQTTKAVHGRKQLPEAGSAQAGG